MDLANIDAYESVSIHIKTLLENYGMGLVMTHDRGAYDKYFEPMKKKEIRNSIVNEVKMKYLEKCPLNENYEKNENDELSNKIKEEIDD
jgi:hypothetical protein